MFGWILLFSATIASCGSVDPEPENAVRVLFVGNSLTYTNNLPAIVEALADEAGGRRLVYEMVAFPNYSLEDHWNEGSARASLADGGWDFVVLQQGPSSLPENQVQLKTWATTFAADARSYGTEPALLTVWPSASRLFALPDVIHAYAAAAAEVDGILLPAGTAWRNAWRQDPSLPLYGPDDFHPSMTGSYLAALVVYGGLFDASPKDLPSNLKLKDGSVVRIPAETARLLSDAAAEAFEDDRQD